MAHRIGRTGTGGKRREAARRAAARAKAPRVSLYEEVTAAIIALSSRLQAKTALAHRRFWSARKMRDGQRSQSGEPPAGES